MSSASLVALANGACVLAAVVAFFVWLVRAVDRLAASMEASPDALLA